MNIKFLLCDICGVIHNGANLIEGAIEFLEACKGNRIKVVLFSNTPRRSVIVENTLFDKFKLEKGQHYFDILTSCDFFISQKDKYIKKNSKCFFFGQDKDLVNITNLDAIQTYSAEEANFILINGKFYDERDEEIEQNLLSLKEKGIPAYCINPDLTAQINGIETSCTGSIAKQYQDIGGNVEYFGKPYVGIYNFALEKFNFNKKETLAIGDSLRTDIAGANNFGIKSVLVKTGIENPKNITMPDLIVNNLKELDFNQIR